MIFVFLWLTYLELLMIKHWSWPDIPQAVSYCLMESCLSLGSPKVEPEKRNGVLEVSLGGDLRKQEGGSGESETGKGRHVRVRRVIEVTPPLEAMDSWIPPIPPGKMQMPPWTVHPKDQGCWGVYHPVPAGFGWRFLPRTGAQSITEDPVLRAPRSAYTCLHSVPPKTCQGHQGVRDRSSPWDEEESTVSPILCIRDWICPGSPSWKVANPEQESRSGLPALNR